jgi:hypothetical protein
MGQHTAATSDENKHPTANSRKRNLAATKENPYFTAKHDALSPQMPGYGTIVNSFGKLRPHSCQY